MTTPQSSENLNFTLLFDYAVLLGAVFKIVDINSIVSRFTMRDERCLDPHTSRLLATVLKVSRQAVGFKRFHSQLKMDVRGVYLYAENQRDTPTITAGVKQTMAVIEVVDRIAPNVRRWNSNVQ